MASLTLGLNDAYAMDATAKGMAKAPMARFLDLYSMYKYVMAVVHEKNTSDS